MATKRFLAKLIEMSPLNIVGSYYDIILHDKRWLETGTPGTVNFPFGKIYLDTFLSDDRILEILLHEILEIIVDRFTIKNLTHPELCAIEFGLMDVFRHNYGFRKAIGHMKISSSIGNTYAEDDFGFKEKEVDTALQELLHKKGKKEKKSTEDREKQEAEGVE